jgi:twitching motility protein PilI
VSPQNSSSSPMMAGLQPDALLGVEVGGENGRKWLLSLSDVGEVVSLPPLHSSPLTQPWFLGLANVRGTLYGVTDFSAFCGFSPTLKTPQARLLLVGSRHGNNCALLVSRVLGLRQPKQLLALQPHQRSAGSPAQPWEGSVWREKQDQTYAVEREGRLDEHREWTLLDVAALLAAPLFLNVAL